ncbi:MAG: hypothetical protein ACE5JE_03170 [Thermoplasmata archaeon]
MRPKGAGQARIAYLLSLWPFAFFAFAIGTTWLLFFSIAASAEAFSEALWTLFGNFVFHVVMGQMAGASPLLSSLAPIALLSGLGGTVFGFALRWSREDEDIVKVATRAGIFGLSSLAMYAFLFWSWFGFGR